VLGRRAARRIGCDGQRDEEQRREEEPATTDAGSADAGRSETGSSERESSHRHFPFTQSAVATSSPDKWTSCPVPKSTAQYLVAAGSIGRTSEEDQTFTLATAKADLSMNGGAWLYESSVT